MTVPHAATGGSDTSVTSYEELRSRVLAGAPFGSHFGLVLLQREGMAAWMARRSAGAVSVQPVANPDRRAAVPLVSDEIHASIVRVLASMAMAGREERRA